MTQDKANSAKQRIAPAIDPVEKYANIGFGKYHNWKTEVGIGTRPNLNTNQVMIGMTKPQIHIGNIKIALNATGVP